MKAWPPSYWSGYNMGSHGPDWNQERLTAAAIPADQTGLLFVGRSGSGFVSVWA